MAGPVHIVDFLKQEHFRDISRSNFFEIEFFTFDKPKFRLAQNLIRSVQVPQILMGDIEIRRMNRTFTMPGSITYTPLIINVYDEIDGNTRAFFQNWLKEHVIDVEKGFFKPGLETAYHKIDIYQLDGNHTRVSKVRLYYAYPKMIGEIDLNMDSEDTLNNFNISFGYTYYRYSNDVGQNFRELDK